MRDNRGGVLIIVMWVSFGLVSIALYFAQSMSLELKGADHRAAAIAAGQATEGAARYVAYLLSHVTKPGQPPDAAATEQVEQLRQVGLREIGLDRVLQGGGEADDVAPDRLQVRLRPNSGDHLLLPGGSVEHMNEEPGSAWLKRVTGIYEHCVWLNPVPKDHWSWTPSIKAIEDIMEKRMFPLTLGGLDGAMKELMR